MGHHFKDFSWPQICSIVDQSFFEFSLSNSGSNEPLAHLSKDLSFSSMAKKDEASKIFGNGFAVLTVNASHFPFLSIPRALPPTIFKVSINTSTCPCCMLQSCFSYFNPAKNAVICALASDPDWQTDWFPLSFPEPPTWDPTNIPDFARSIGISVNHKGKLIFSHTLPQKGRGT